ncbi:MAG: hypothetical protein JEY94_05955 [Melioribacteraceae bacterium]|nr:hypothetical protein [Melioribacteraceae bacterium]
MKNCLKICLLIILIFSLSNSITSQENSYSKFGYKLNFVNNDSTTTPEFCKKLVDTFYEVYPKLAERFNKNTAGEVTFIIDPDFIGVAATGNDTVRFSSNWFHKRPGDIDVVTHEVMHIVQAYPNNSGPWWITEGIADYARYKFGVDNEGGGWILPKVDSTQNFDNSYRITARFFAWLELNENQDLINNLDSKMRSKKYTSEFWMESTGKTIEQLWKEYLKNPELASI